MTDVSRTNRRLLRLVAMAVIVAIAAILGNYLIGPATNPRTTSSISAPAQGEPENLAAPANPAGGSKP